ncbi:fimbrial biogenesis usher protein [Enterobacteriaceae bacterium C23F]
MVAMLYQKYQLTPLALAIALASACSYAENVYNPAFLSSDPAAVADLSRFESGNQAAGNYRVDIWVNDVFQLTKDLAFNTATKPGGDGTGLTPCLNVRMLERLGVNTSANPGLATAAADSCINLPESIPGAATEFDFDQQRLNISVPQAAMTSTARGYIPPSQWDEGISALLLNYTFSGANSRDASAGGTEENSYFLGLNSGFNYGPWRLRDYSTWNYSGKAQSGDRWNHINTYLQRAIIPLRSELTIGDSSTLSDVFDSLTFRGVQLASDDNMLPDSLRGFAPTVRGIANTHARVTIKQNGYTLYQTYVSPGAFEIKDLFPTSSSGDLSVEVKESDGSINRYSIPYSSVPVLQREGRIKYAITAGDYRSSDPQQRSLGFAQSTLIWGLPAGFTAYGGTQLASRYKAVALGMGLNIGEFGALSVDVTQARSTLIDDTTHNGASLRFLYAKSLNNFGTNFQLLGYRYSTQGFYTLDETSWKKMSGFVSDDNETENAASPQLIGYYNLNNNKRDKLQFNVSQQLSDYGSFYFSGSRQTYWQTQQTNSLVQAGYSGNLLGVSWNLSYSYNKIPGLDGADKRVSLGISVPLSQWLSPGGDISRQDHSLYATYNISNDTHGNTTQSAGFNGTALDDNNLNYSLQQGYQSGSQHNANGSINVGYDGAWGSPNVGYNYSDNGDYQQINYGMSGGVVVHDEGITLSQPLGDTNVLIAAPGAKNVRVEDVSGLKTDWRGYAVVPYATTYRRNRMSLDTNSMPENVDLDDNVTDVVPTRGALVRADFNAHVGARALITLNHAGKPVPFGALVSSNGSNSIVGDDGQVYLSGLPQQGTLTVKWGKAQNQTCQASYQLPDDANGHAINTLNGVCQ